MGIDADDLRGVVSMMRAEGLLGAYFEEDSDAPPRTFERFELSECDRIRIADVCQRAAEALEIPEVQIALRVYTLRMAVELRSECLAALGVAELPRPRLVRILGREGGNDG